MEHCPRLFKVVLMISKTPQARNSQRKLQLRVHKVLSKTNIKRCQLPSQTFVLVSNANKETKMRTNPRKSRVMASLHALANVVRIGRVIKKYYVYFSRRYNLFCRQLRGGKSEEGFHSVSYELRKYYFMFVYVHRETHPISSILVRCFRGHFYTNTKQQWHFLNYSTAQDLRSN